MNRFFSPEIRESYAPRRAYARLDQTEPPDPRESEEAVFAYEAVDAEWPGFQSEGALPLDQPDQLLSIQRNLWWMSRKYGGEVKSPLKLDNPFERLPLFRLELTLGRRDWMFQQLLELGGAWLEFMLGDSGDRPVDVYSGLFAAPVTRYLASLPKPAAEQSGLQTAFDLDAFPDAEEDEIEEALSSVCGASQLLVFDVGQGSASALVCFCGRLGLYYDFGCGVYRNARTQPAPPLRFCHCGSPIIVLSHWDADHWAAAQLDRRALAHSWIAPRQSIGPKHKAFASDILAQGGRLLIVPNGKSIYPPVHGGLHTISLRRGNGSDRNGSGLVLVVEDDESGRAWLLTGDAGYDRIPHPLPTDFAAIVAPHHGADMGRSSIPPARTGSPNYARVFYSFGPDNKHGRTSVTHPTSAGVAAHVNAGWRHGSWLPSSPGHVLAGADTLATAQHLTTHLTGATAGWTYAPTPFRLCPACQGTMNVTQA